MGICRRRVHLPLLLAGVAAAAFLLTSRPAPAIAESAQAGGVSAARPLGATGPASTWRILLLVFRQTDTDYVDLNGVTRHLRAELPQSDIDALLAAFEGSIGPAVQQWSGGQAAWDVDVRYPSQPISQVASAGANSRWVAPSCISAAMQEYYTPGVYDHVMVYWRSSDDAGNAIPSEGWGWTSRFDAFGYATVTYPGWSPWNALVADMNTQVWIHEWLHSVCWFYGDLGYRMPLYDADGAGPPDYYPDKPPYPGWGSFYSDLMNQLVVQGGAVSGIPREAWARATIRDSLDHVPPVTTQTGADDAWHNKPVTVTFTATDAGSAVSGVFATRYAVDAGSWRTGTTATVVAPMDHSNDGLHTVKVSSTDNVGNEESPKELLVRIDTAGPATAAKATSGRRGRAVALRYKVADSLSPMATAIRIVVRNSRGDAVKTIRPTARSTATWYSARWTPKARGTYRYHVYAKDLAGNAQSRVGSARVVVR